MMRPTNASNVSLGVVFAVSLAAAFAVGAWQGRHAAVAEAPIDRASVQSGGVVAEPDRSVPSAADALTHARVPVVSEASASAF